MTWLDSWITLPPTQTLAWTLLHFLWQGTVVAALVAALLGLAARTEARVRHGICLAGLVALGLLPLVTYGVLASSAQAAAADLFAPFTLGDVLPSSQPAAAWMSWLCVAWALGAAVFQLRALMQLLRARDISRRGVEPAPAWLVEMVEQLRRRLDLTRPVAVMRSSLATVPAVVGWLSPVVLIPLGALDTLSPEQLRAVLAHELAHVRRHDYLINLLQLLLESILFFHPAVWWIGRRLRDEREYCCDDLAVAACGNALIFARALSTLDALRKPAPTAPAGVASLSSQGGSLLKRITRLVDQPPRHQFGLLAGTSLAALMFSTVAASGAVAALCDDVCLADAVSIHEGLTVIDSAGHDADCTLLLTRDDDGGMKVRCIDHIFDDTGDAPQQSHFRLRLGDPEVLLDSETRVVLHDHDGHDDHEGIHEEGGSSSWVVELHRDDSVHRQVELDIVDGFLIDRGQGHTHGRIPPHPRHGVSDDESERGIIILGRIPPHPRHGVSDGESERGIIIESRSDVELELRRHHHVQAPERTRTIIVRPEPRRYELRSEGRDVEADMLIELAPEVRLETGEYQLYLLDGLHETREPHDVDVQGMREAVEIIELREALELRGNTLRDRFEMPRPQSIRLHLREEADGDDSVREQLHPSHDNDHDGHGDSNHHGSDHVDRYRVGSRSTEQNLLRNLYDSVVEFARDVELPAGPQLIEAADVLLPAELYKATDVAVAVPQYQDV